MKKELILYLNAIQIPYREIGKIMHTISSVEELKEDFQSMDFLSKKVWKKSKSP